MPKCIVHSASGERIEVEADGYELLRESGFVILKRRIATGNEPVRETTAAIFYKPQFVLLPPPDDGITKG